jgi:hypothetical protein
MPTGQRLIPCPCALLPHKRRHYLATRATCRCAFYAIPTLTQGYKSSCSGTVSPFALTISFRRYRWSKVSLPPWILPMSSLLVDSLATLAYPNQDPNPCTSFGLGLGAGHRLSMPRHELPLSPWPNAGERCARVCWALFPRVETVSRLWPPWTPHRHRWESTSLWNPCFRVSPMASSVTMSYRCSVEHFSPPPTTTCLLVSRHRPCPRPRRDERVLGTHHMPGRPWPCQAAKLGELMGPGNLCHPTRHLGWATLSSWSTKGIVIFHSDLFWINSNEYEIFQKS